MGAREAIAGYDAVRVRGLPDEALIVNVREYGPTQNTDGDWWRACVHELACRYPLQAVDAERDDVRELVAEIDRGANPRSVR